ncbi:coiled-coil domain-containing protein 55-domain containing protein [Schizothecium vesticola]|uniref:Coiled-coil domain-containing protein 55-domain containing protein n=1 Tax=Schizothecium vesticola TaxID=314040 RepID=A0AA40F8X7_9PEZI|nr:coiled-coil domain-containing protein 55-domain containing protein [Schizothecium vesticola]
MSTNTKPKIAFSFGLSKKPSPSNPSSSAPTPAKPTAFSFSKKPTPSAPLTKRRPANFGADDSDNDDSSLLKPEAVVAISELDDDNLSLPPPTTADAPKPKPPHSTKLKSAPPPPSSKPKPKTAAAADASQFSDLSSALTSQRYASAAAAADPSIYDYDAVYDSLKAASHAKKAEPADVEKRPRYFDALQKAADVRERDRQIAEEKRLKRERDAEGDEFADKEKFVTEAYKRQQEENRRIEAEEAAREAAEAKRNKNRGMADFYKDMLERGELEHQAVVKAVEEGLGKKEEGKGEEEAVKTAAERAREINALGGNVVMNDDGEVVDKRQLLKGGLNIAPKKKAEVQVDKAKQAAGGSSAAGIPTRGVYNMSGGKNAMRERQTRMLEAQLEQSLKRAREEEEEDKAKIEVVAKSRKTETEISSAKERYLARKKAAEEAKKKEDAEGV